MAEDKKMFSPALIKGFLTVLIIVIISELIGINSFSVGIATVTLLPMLFAVIFGILVTPSILGKVIPQLKKLVDEDVVEFAAPMVMITLLPLGVKYGTLVGPNVVKIIQAGPAFILQEFGNVATIFVALPIALLLGLKREAVGASVSICREVTLGIMGDKYGIDSPEGTGTLGTYLVGTVLGTIFFGLLGSFSLATGLHPLALAMASGMGSGSMMTAASSSLAASVDPALSDTVLAYAATSNMLTGVTGLYMVLFVSIPLVNKLYDILEPKIGRPAPKVKEGGKDNG